MTHVIYLCVFTNGSTFSRLWHYNSSDTIAPWLWLVTAFDFFSVSASIAWSSLEPHHAPQSCHSSSKYHHCLIKHLFHSPLEHHDHSSPKYHHCLIKRRKVVARCTATRCTHCDPLHSQWPVALLPFALTVSCCTHCDPLHYKFL